MKGLSLSFNGKDVCFNPEKDYTMSDKTQHTAASLRQKMLNRYGDSLHHKHNKNHLEYRQHCRSHPVDLSRAMDQEEGLSSSTGLLREFKLRKMRKRLDKGRIH